MDEDYTEEGPTTGVLAEEGVAGAEAVSKAKAHGFETPHLLKLLKLRRNPKLPPRDVLPLEDAFKRYEAWINKLSRIKDEVEDRTAAIEGMVEALNDYKKSVDVTLIYNSTEDFLYRQSGQVKLSSSVMEEFLPWLVASTILKDYEALQIQLGPRKSFAGLSFRAAVRNVLPGAGPVVRAKKDQDFTISRQLFIRSSHTGDFAKYAEVSTQIAYIAAECKTNLDKTMFQEAVATAHDLKTAVMGSRYFLLAEWLDMPPLNIARTDIDGVYFLRRAKRLGSEVRRGLSTVEGRNRLRATYLKHYDDHPFDAALFTELLGRMETYLDDQDPSEREVLGRGYF